MGHLQYTKQGWKKTVFSVHMLVCIAVLLFAVGCGGGREIRTLPDIKPRKLTYEEGSIWPKEAVGVFLFKDTKAKTVGDTLTVHIIEQIKAVNNASTRTGSEMQKGVKYNMDSLADGITTRNGIDVGLGGASSFEGIGATTRSGSLKTTLTAIVVKVLPNGNLMIDGAKELNVNDDSQIVKITGVVRPEDISRSNSVVSTNIAEAIISYDGAGALDSSQRPGWVEQYLLSWIWPF